MGILKLTYSEIRDTKTLGVQSGVLKLIYKSKLLISIMESDVTLIDK